MSSNHRVTPQKTTFNVTANAQAFGINTDGYNSLTLTMVAASLVGHNATFEVSNDAKCDPLDPNKWDGVSGNWYGIMACRSNAATYESTTLTLAATPTNGWVVPVGPYKMFRVRIVAHTSGSALYQMQPECEAATVYPSAPTLSSGSMQVVGPTAHSAAAATTGPVIVGGVVLSALDTTLVSGDAARNTITTSGQVLIKPFGLPETDWTYASATGGIINTTDVAVKAAAGAGIRNFVTGFQLKNTSATATEVVIKDGATVIWRGHLSASMVTAENYTLQTPLKGTANTAINVACITTAAAVFANLQGFTGV